MPSVRRRAVFRLNVRLVGAPPAAGDHLTVVSMIATSGSHRYTRIPGHEAAGEVIDVGSKAAERVRRLQRYGARQARKLGIKASQVEQLIEEYRKDR